MYRVPDITFCPTAQYSDPDLRNEHDDAIYNLLNPPSHLGNVERTADERRMLYVARDEPQALIFISFDPAIKLTGLKRWGGLCSKFGRFANRQRPKCTTMPWSIWPSLVVLWGVCWMFYTPFDATSFERYFDDDELSLFNPGKTSHAYMDIENIDGRVIEVTFDPAFVSYSSGYEHFTGDFETEIGFNDATYASHIEQNSPKDYNLNPFEQQSLAQISSENTVGSGSLVGFGSRLEEIPSSTAGHMNESTQKTASAPRSQVYVNGSQSINTSQTAHIDEQHIASLSAVAMTVPTGLATVLPQQVSTENTSSEQAQSPSRNAEGKLICIHFDCDRNRIFKRHCDWQ